MVKRKNAVLIDSDSSDSESDIDKVSFYNLTGGIFIIKLPLVLKFNYRNFKFRYVYKNQFFD